MPITNVVQNFQANAKFTTFDTLISTSAPLGAAGVFTSDGDTRFFDRITGTLFADQAGTISIKYSVDGINFDGEQTRAYVASELLCIDTANKARFVRVTFTNGAIAQTVFRLNLLGKN